MEALLEKAVMPNFLVIGAGKSGTTSLNDYLAQHPDIYMSPVKEPNYFALKNESPLSSLSDPEQMYHYPQAVYKREAYEQLFEDVRGEQVIGEVSPMYLYNPEAPIAIDQEIPNVRLVAILRDPVDRLYSRYMHLARDNRLGSLSLDSLFDKDSLWWRRPDLIPEGFYGEYLQRYLLIFPREQIKLFTFNDFKQNTREVLREIYEFLGVDASFEPQVTVRRNKSGVIKNPLINAVLGGNGTLKRKLENMLPSAMSWVKKQPVLNKGLTHLRNQFLKYDPLNSNLRCKIYQDIYAQDIARLEKLTTLDLTAWKC